MAGWLQMLSRGTSQLMLRRVATAIGSVIACGSMVCFSATRSSYIATLAYCGIVVGNSFDYSGFLPNFIEVNSLFIRYCGRERHCLHWLGP